MQNKMDALKSGYENLERLLNGNPERFPRIPTLHDQRLLLFQNSRLEKGFEG